MRRKILGMATVTCKKITELTETKEVAKLSVLDKFRYTCHLFFCKVCSSYVKQSQLIEKAMEGIFSATPFTGEVLDDSRKNGILEKLRKEK